jgi:predicted dehydrogenase
MTQYRIGIIGAGGIAATMHIPVLRAMSGVQIDWIIDADRARAEKLARLHRTRAAGVDELTSLSSPDAILLALPLPPRAPYYAHFAKGNSAILAEKPMANTLAEHDALAAAFPEWQLAAGYQRRYYAQFRLMKKIISTGTFGPLRGIKISEGGRVTRTGGGGDYQTMPWSEGGGIIKNLGCHSLDLALWLTGALEFTIKDRRLQIDSGCDLACHAEAVLKTAEGEACALEFDASWVDRMANTMIFTFDHVSLICPISPAEKIAVYTHDGALLSTLDASTSGAVTSAQAFFLEWHDILDAAAAKRPQPLSASATRPVADFMDQVLAQ